MQFIRDTWLIFHRSLWLTIRQPTWIVFGMMLPLLYLFLFGPLLEGATQAAGAGSNAFNWFVPGLLDPDRDLRDGIRRLRPHRRASQRRHRAHAGDPDEPSGDARSAARCGTSSS